jgi:hypothetical protein
MATTRLSSEASPPISPAEARARAEALIEAYKQKNPEKAAQKEARGEFARYLAQFPVLEEPKVGEVEEVKPKVVKKKKK